MSIAPLKTEEPPTLCRYTVEVTQGAHRGGHHRRNGVNSNGNSSAWEGGHLSVQFRGVCKYGVAANGWSPLLCVEVPICWVEETGKSGTQTAIKQGSPVHARTSEGHTASRTGSKKPAFLTMVTQGEQATAAPASSFLSSGTGKKGFGRKRSGSEV